MFSGFTRPRVTRALFIETGTYDDQYLRPFAVNADGSTVATFTELVNRGNYSPASNGMQIKPFQNVDFASFATDIIRPTTQATGQVGISNGFSQKRYRFLIEFQIDLGGGTAMRQFLTGYTDSDQAITGLMMAGSKPAVNRNMVLYFNNMFSLQYINQNGFMVPRMNDVSQILRCPDLIQSAFNQTNMLAPVSSVTTMLPYDVFDHLGDLSRNNGSNTTTISDTNGFLSNPVRRHTRENNLPSSFLAKVFNGFSASVVSNNMGTESINGGFGESTMSDLFQNGQTPFTQGASHTAEGLLSKEPVIRDIWMQTNFRTMRAVTYAELDNVFPGFDSVVVFRSRGQAMNVAPAQNQFTVATGMGASWGGSGHESVIAAMLSQVVPSLMMQNALHYINFTASNAGGQPAFGISPSAPPMSLIDGIPIEQFAETFKNRFMNEIFRSLCMNNNVLLNLHVSCNVMGDTKISIGFNSMTQIDFFCPSFCDSLVSPVLTNDPMSLQNAAHGFDVMAQAAGLSPNINTALNTALGLNVPPMQTNNVLF